MISSPHLSSSLRMTHMNSKQLSLRPVSRSVFCGFIVGDGVDENGAANAVQVDPQDYFGRIASQIGEQFVYDASFVKLRELQLTYRLPSRWFASSAIQLASVSLIGRNLWLIHSEIDNVDPESNFTNNNVQGLEHSGVPQVRSFGFNINVRL